MKHDFDDTITAGMRSAARPVVPDLDDTITIIPKNRPTKVEPRDSTPSPNAQQRKTTAPSLNYRVNLDGDPRMHSLDRPCVFGRNPRPPRIAQGMGPRLISVTSRTREVSETHLEVRQLGASVIVTDLRSTNGSVVLVPGNASRKLRQGESVVVSAGTLVDIGDGNIIRILPRRILE